MPRAHSKARLLLDNRGAAMVEFGFAVVPFTLFVLLMIEAFLSITSQYFLEAATVRAAHEISVHGHVTRDAVVAAVCNGQLMLYSKAGCEANLQVGITPVTKDAPPPYALTSEGELNAGQFTVAGGRHDILLVRTALPVPFSLPILKPHLNEWAVAGTVTRVSPYAPAEGAAE
ncbi:TadE/TadG family type IV pilus assembly protein [Xanthobacter sp. TB0139]|uniref:TadE/TadG family type IV pilus assembly protein n=1 Tax=Xanthobacter sp. TB0139 TaxID=3459178 RepID=UPI004039AFBB